MKWLTFFCFFLMLLSCKKKQLSKANIAGEWKLQSVAMKGKGEPFRTDTEVLQLRFGLNDSFKTNKPLFTSITPGYHISVTSGIWKLDSINRDVTLYPFRDFFYEFSIDKFDGTNLVLTNKFEKTSSKMEIPESYQATYTFIKIE